MDVNFKPKSEGSKMIMVGDNTVKGHSFYLFVTQHWFVVTKEERKREDTKRKRYFFFVLFILDDFDSFLIFFFDDFSGGMKIEAIIVYCSHLRLDRYIVLDIN